MYIYTYTNIYTSILDKIYMYIIVRLYINIRIGHNLEYQFHKCQVRLY